MIDISIGKILDGAQGVMNLEVDLKIAEGELLALFGPSGAGKTTLLRLLAGLDQPDYGYIRVKGYPWFDRLEKANSRPRERRVGYVFQDYALFPNMDVRRNIEFGMKNAKEDAALVDELMEVMGLADLQKLKPRKLSGGQKQRIALARAIAMQPEILLLDEPLSALDWDMRGKLQGEILQFHKRLKMTTVLVSHELPEVYRMADRVAQMDYGKIVSHGTPAAVFGRIDGPSGPEVLVKILKMEIIDATAHLEVIMDRHIQQLSVPAESIPHLREGMDALLRLVPGGYRLELLGPRL